MATTNTPTKGRTVRPELDPYLGPADVAEVLGMHRTQAWRLMSARTIPGVVDLSTNGERATLRVRRSDLAAWIDSRAL